MCASTLSMSYLDAGNEQKKKANKAKKRLLSRRPPLSPNYPPFSLSFLSLSLLENRQHPVLFFGRPNRLLPLDCGALR